MNCSGLDQMAENVTSNSTWNCSSLPITNSSEEPWTPPPFDPSASNILLAIVLTTLDIVTIFGNLLVLVSFLVERRLLQPFNLFIMNLAVTDFLVAITAMTFYTLDTLLGYWPFGSVMCGVWIYFDFAMTFASVFTLVAISMDRFWCVTWAIHYKMHNNRNKTCIILAVIWVCVLLIWTPPFIGDRLERSDEHYCIWEPSENREFVLFVAVVGHYIPCIIMVFCYFKVFYVMKRQANLIASSTNAAGVSRSIAASHSAFHSTSVAPRNTQEVLTQEISSHLRPGNSDGKSDTTHAQSNGNQNSQGSGGNRPASITNDPRSNVTGDNSERTSQSREKRIFITLTYVVSSYLICWFPFYIAFDTYAWRPELVPSGLYTFFFWMTYVNSTLNPFIYAYTSKEFRSAFLKVLKRTYKCT